MMRFHPTATIEEIWEALKRSQAANRAYAREVEKLKAQLAAMIPKPKEKIKALKDGLPVGENYEHDSTLQI